MMARTIAYGTTREVRVVAVEGFGDKQVVGCGDARASGRPPEGYILIEAAGTYDCRPGDLGTLTFERADNAAGGFWSLEITARVSKGGTR